MPCPVPTHPHPPSLAGEHGGRALYLSARFAEVEGNRVLSFNLLSVVEGGEGPHPQGGSTGGRQPRARKRKGQEAEQEAEEEAEEEARPGWEGAMERCRV